MKYIVLYVVAIALIIWTRLFYRELFTENKENIVVTLTTSPRRLAHIKPTIDSIMQQSVRPDVIMLNLPFVFKRHNTTFEHIPSFITDNPLVQINKCEDMGPATKLLGALPAVSNPEAVMIAIDDDIAFAPDFISRFMRYVRTYPEAALTGSPLRRGVPMQTKQFFSSVRDPELPLVSSEFVEGYTGIVVRRKFMNNFNYDDVRDAPASCVRGDDFVFSNHLRKNNIPILMLPDIIDSIRVLPLGDASDALHLGADGQSSGHDYESCARHFRDKHDLYLTHFAPCTPECSYDIKQIP